MPYTLFSSHAPTGLSPKFIVSPNQYSDNGRNIGYPSKYSVYVNKISEADGSTVVTETREVSELVGNRLYLWHRPITKSDGTVTTISIGGGGAPVLDNASTNAKSGYIVFSTIPTSQFTVTYIAAPDCITASNLNTIQDDVMELQKTIGLLSNTGTASIRNVAYGIFNSPSDATVSGVVPNAVYLSHLARNIVIASSDDPSLTGTLGNSHTIQIGRSNDEVIVQGTGLHLVQPSSTRSLNVTLGTRTGDVITYKGQFSGAGPVTIGGPEWSNIGGVEWASRGYSGVVLSEALTGSYYSGAMLRVHGDVAVMGGIKSVGQLVVITETGTTSVVLGDWTVQDELFVYGDTKLNDTSVGNLTVRGDLIALDSNLVCNNLYGDSTIDGLDCSEIQHTYKTVGKKRINNSVIDGRHTTIDVPPKLDVYSPYYHINNSGLIGEVFCISGSVLSYAVDSVGSAYGVRLYVNNIHLPVVSGTFTGLIEWTGTTEAQLPGTGRSNSGLWSPGLMDPGKLWVKVTDGVGAGYKAPIYGYKIMLADTVDIFGINLYCPDSDGYTLQAGDNVIIYNPGTLPYNFITAQGGASPTFIVEASPESPLRLAFDEEVRVLNNSTASLSMYDALVKSMVDLPASDPTGIAYIFAQARGTDPENPPTFKARATPFRMPNEVVMGEVVARYNLGTWDILDTICYRPNGLYDSGWIPLQSGCRAGLNSGRMIPEVGSTANSALGRKAYFQHYLGPELDSTNLNIDFYLASVPTYPTRTLTGPLAGFNQTHSDLYSFHGQDHGASFGNTGPSGRFVRMPLQSTKTSTTDPRHASMFYLDSRVVGVNFGDTLTYDTPTGSISRDAGLNKAPKNFQYARLVMRRDV